MRFKDFLTESSIPDWIKAFSDDQLNSYEKDHPDLHDDTKRYIQLEKLNRLKPKDLKKVTYKILKIGRKWIEGIEPGKSYKNKIERNDATKNFKEGETYTFNAEVKWEYSKYGTSVTVFPATDEVKEVNQTARNRQEIIKWLGYIENSLKEGRLYQNGLDKVKSYGIQNYPDLKAKLDSYIQEYQEMEKKKRETPSYGQSWTESYGGKFCHLCKKPIDKGQEVRYQYLNGLRNLTHVNCEVSNKEREEKIIKKQEEDKKYFHIGGGSGYGDEELHVGEVIKATQDQINRGYPEFLYVVSSDKKYFKYDGLSFGVGDDSGYVYSAKCRPATEEEAKPIQEKIEKDKNVRKAKLRLEEIKNTIMKTGEYPKGNNFIEGQKILDTQDIYGGGDWFVITKDHIWYVKNNGMDGDDWSRNNVRTVGAGAIGWKIPIDEKLVSELNELKKIINERT